MEKVIKLNLACGRDYRDDWINIDNKQMYNGDFWVDIEADILHMTWEENTVDTILLNHFIQYVTPPQMVILLKRWYSWLKPNGTIYIEAGNILEVCKKILEATSIKELHGKDGIMQLYGIDDNIWNKWAWCPASLTTAMNEAGFKDLLTKPGYLHRNPERDFMVMGTK